MKNLQVKRLVVAVAFALSAFTLSAQKYSDGLIDKTVAVVDNEMIMISDIESEIQEDVKSWKR